MANKNSYLEAWSELRGKIKNDILQNGWNTDIKACTQIYGNKDLDASLLLMEDYGFIEASDPMYVSTVLNIKAGLSKNGMMFRYINKDDFGVPPNSMLICTFWLINSMYKIGYRDEAKILFENILKCSNHLGLFSEHIDVNTNQLLGNFPQGYSHLGLIQSALILNGMIPEITEEKFSFINPDLMKSVRTNNKVN
jgi:GH15 family glucan-1,4-alpha-glucosidase